MVTTCRVNGEGGGLGGKEAFLSVCSLDSSTAHNLKKERNNLLQIKFFSYLKSFNVILKGAVLEASLQFQSTFRKKYNNG